MVIKVLRAKRTLLCLLVLLTLLLTGFGSAAALEIDERAPDFSLDSTSTTPAKLSDFSGKVVLVDFWASWCASCAKSLSWLNGLQEKFGRDRFQVIAVNVDQERKSAEAMLKRLGPDVVVGFDPAGATPERYQVQAMPSAFLIARDGRVIGTYKGSKASDKREIEERVGKLMRDG